MEIGVGSYAYRWSIGIRDYKPARPLGPVALLERVAALGAKVVQYADNMPLHTESAETLQGIARVAREHDVSVELGMDGASPTNLRRYLAIASQLDAAMVRLTLDRDDLARPRRELMDDLADSADAYQEAGSTLALENHFLLPSRELVALVEELDHPAVGVCLDVANSIANHEWPWETIERLAPLARNLHLKDYRIGLDPYGVGFRIAGTPIGQGELDIGRVFRTLREAGRDVNVIVEHWIPREAVNEDRPAEELEDDWTRESLEAARSHAEASGS